MNAHPPANGVSLHTNGTEAAIQGAALARSDAEHAVVHRREHSLPAEVEPAAPDEDSALAQVARLFRGREWLAGLLAAALAGLCGWAGYEMGGGVYTSYAQLHIRPYVPKVLHATEQNGLLPMYDSFVDSQVQLLRNSRTVSLALEDEAWRRTQRGNSAGVTRDFADELSVIREGEMVMVRYTDAVPSVAQAGTTSLIHAYQKMSLESQSRSDGETVELLQQYLTSLEGETRALEQRIRVIAQDAGTDDLAAIYSLQFDQLAEDKRKLATADELLNNLRRRAKAATEGSTTIDVDEVAQRSPDVAALQQRVRAAQRQVHSAAASAALGENNPQVKALQRELDLAQSDLDAAVSRFRGDPATALQGEMVTLDGQTLNAAALASQVEQMTQRVKDEAESLKQLGRQNLQITELKRNASGLQSKVDDTRARLDSLRLEGQLPGRVQVISEGNLPAEVSKDTRVGFAFMGGLGGAVAGLCAVGLLGLTDTRVRSAREAGDDLSRNGLMPRSGPMGAGPLLGLLPHLDESRSGPEEATRAARCVHEIRLMLQARLEDGAGGPGRRRGRDGLGRVVAITGPAAASGKTTLTLSLGLSLASAGDRVLLVDADFAGAGVSRATSDLTRKSLGDTLLRNGLLDAAQFAAAEAQSRAAGRDLGEWLVEHERLTEPELAAALRSQEADADLGLLDAVDGESLETCVRDTGIARLHVLPVGSADAGDASSLNRAALHRLLRRCREEFDWVLVDTGPVPGSLEAVAMAGVVDGVVLTVSRRDLRTNVSRAAQAVTVVGGQLLGFVFNRARTGDLAQFSHVAESYANVSGRGLHADDSRPSNGRGRRHAPGDRLKRADLSRLGAVPSAVAASTMSEAAPAPTKQ